MDGYAIEGITTLTASRGNSAQPREQIDQLYAESETRIKLCENALDFFLKRDFTAFAVQFTKFIDTYLYPNAQAPRTNSMP
jgi:hypothetical protein